MKNLFIKTWEVLDTLITFILIAGIFYSLYKLLPVILPESIAMVLRVPAVWIVFYIIAAIICIQVGGVKILYRFLDLIIKSGDKVKYAWCTGAEYDGKDLIWDTAIVRRTYKGAPPSNFSGFFLDPEEDVLLTELDAGEEKPRIIPARFIGEIAR